MLKSNKINVTLFLDHHEREWFFIYLGHYRKTLPSIPPPTQKGTRKNSHKRVASDLKENQHKAEKEVWQEAIQFFL